MGVVTVRHVERDHPRVCGEQGDAHRFDNMEAGSSPRVRGADMLHQIIARGEGIIPACAGSSPRTLPQDNLRRDHPRVCGEQLSRATVANVHTGSSPRVRGAVAGGAAEDRLVGIIPACAGSSARACRAPRSSWDHPRVCGEQRGRLAEEAHRKGSSPRVRGAGKSMVGAVSMFGIIPACAGSRLCRGGTRGPAGDHPRVCGEQTLGGTRWSELSGSSPRVRGAGCLSE